MRYLFRFFGWAESFKGNPNIVYITEIPFNSDNLYQQNSSRMLLGISNASVFFNDNDAEWSLYKNISNFEKRSMLVLGNSNAEYLSYAKKFFYPPEQH